MYILVFGAEYCPFTRKLWPELLARGIPFTYIPYVTGTDKSEYWSQLAPFLKHPPLSFTFPTIVGVLPRSVIVFTFLDAVNPRIVREPKPFQNLLPWLSSAEATTFAMAREPFVYAPKRTKIDVAQHSQQHASTTARAGHSSRSTRSRAS